MFVISYTLLGMPSEFCLMSEEELKEQKILQLVVLVLFLFTHRLSG